VDVVVYTITITVLCTACILAVLIWWPGSDLAWLPVTVLAVSGLGVGGRRETVVGPDRRNGRRVAIAAILASVVGSQAVLSGIALVLMVIVVVVLLSVPSTRCSRPSWFPPSCCSTRPASPMWTRPLRSGSGPS
jgi:hypothetical protein